MGNLGAIIQEYVIATHMDLELRQISGPGREPAAEHPIPIQTLQRHVDLELGELLIDHDVVSDDLEHR
jgi:hypothetical protein